VQAYFTSIPYFVEYCKKNFRTRYFELHYVRGALQQHMNIDIATFGVVLAITHLIQVAVFVLQFKVSEKNQGFGWFLLWSIAEVIGFTAMSLRSIPALQIPALFVQNISIFFGTLCIYAGVFRFFGKEIPRKPVLAVSAAFMVVFGFFVFGRDDPFMRSLLFNGAMAVVSFVTMKVLLASRTPSIANSVIFTAAVFFVHGCVFAGRTLLFVLGAPVSDFFKSTVFNEIPYLDGLIVSLLWTFGFIIMYNQRLTAENREDKANLEMIFETNPDAVLISRLADGVIVKINAGFTALTGFACSESVGRTIIEIGIWVTASERQKLLQALEGTQSFSNREFVFRRKDGSLFTAIVSAKIIMLRGEQHIISVTHDITLRKLSENRIAALLAEKELLLKEVHHRIKNNMTTIKGLLSLQAQTLADSSAVRALEDAENRVQSMALLYDVLYRAPDFGEISLARYLPSLIDEIMSNCGNGTAVRTEKRIDDIVLNVEIIQPLGIILNELLSNIMKYAFTGRPAGCVTVTASPDATGTRVVLVIEDDGNGMPDSVDFGHSTGFGLVLVHELTRQIGGTIRIERVNGTRIILEFPR